MKRLFLLVFVLLSHSAHAEQNNFNLDEFFQNWRNLVAHRLRMAVNIRSFQDREVTFSYLSEQTRLSKAAISKYANGDQAMPVDTGGAIAELLNVSPQWLLGMDLLKDNLESIEQHRSPQSYKKMIRLIKITKDAIIGDIEPEFSKALNCESFLSNVSTDKLIEELESRGYEVRERWDKPPKQ